nr:myosin-15-like [Salvelinus alpinus]
MLIRDGSTLTVTLRKTIKRAQTSNNSNHVVCTLSASGTSACGVASAIMSCFEANKFGGAGPFLRKTDLELLAAQIISFDGKTRAWVPDEKEAYIEDENKQLDGDNVIVEIKDRRKLYSLTVKEEDIQQINPPKFDMIKDMAMLTHLNKASVLCQLSTVHTGSFKGFS